MQDKKHTPIYSGREDESEAREEISNFVIGLAERIDQLQDAEGSGQLEPLRSMAGKLAADAERFGFALLSEVAVRVTGACEELKSETAQHDVLELTDIARRIRLGHRGAA